MENYYDILRECPLFIGILESEIERLLNCLEAKEQNLKKGDVIFSVGEHPESVGIVLEGSVHVVQEDYWGNRSILMDVQPGGIFAEEFSTAEVAELPISAIAHSDCKILLINCRHILTTCTSSCVFHTRLINNLVKTVSNKNIILTRKMQYITKKAVRDRVLSYLSEYALSVGSDHFAIPFNRQELADYLSVERSALSNTLCKMRDEGIIDFEKNRFTLL